MTILRTHHHDGTVGQSATSGGEGYDKSSGAAPTYTAGGFKGQCLAYPTGSSGFFEDQMSAGFCGYYLRLPSSPTANGNFATVKNAAGSNLGFVTVDSSGTISIRNGGTRVATSALVQAVGKWYRHEWHTDAAAGTQELRIFDPATSSTPTEVLTGALVVDTITTLSFGQLTNSGVALELDEVCIADAWPNLGAATATGRLVRRRFTDGAWI